MTSTPLVSVICTFLDAEEFLAEAIDSVVAQSCDAWELLLVDDGSTDSSATIASEYRRRYPQRVRCLAHPGHANCGISASRNLGLDHARGSYVAFIDADDVWRPDKLRDQIALLEAHPQAVMVYGPALIWYGWTGRPEDAQRDRLQPLGVTLDSIVEPPDIVTRFLRSEIMTPLPSSMIVRRSAIEAAGRFEAEFRGFYEDQVFLTKLCLDAPAYAASACWHHYRQHGASYCGTWGGTTHEKAQQRLFWGWVEEYLRARGYVGSEPWTIVQKRLWPSRHPLRYALRSRTLRLRRRLHGPLHRATEAVLGPAAYRAFLDRWRRRHGAAQADPSGGDQV